MRDVDVADDAASDASNLDDLPGPEEFLATAIQKLALKVSPLKVESPVGGLGGSGSPSGDDVVGSPRGPNDDPPSAESSVTYDETEIDAIGEFLAAAASPLRPTSQISVDDRPTSSPKRAMEEMTASLKLEHVVVEAVVEDIIDEAEMRAAYPDMPPSPRDRGVLLDGKTMANQIQFNRFNDELETPMETAPTSPSPSVGGNLHLLDGDQMRELQSRGSAIVLSAESADEAMRAARASLSRALSTVAESLAAETESGVNEEEIDVNAAGVAEAIAVVWQACDSASAALAVALERQDTLESIGSETSRDRKGATHGGAAKEKRKMLEEAVFLAWMQSDNSFSNLMFTDGPLPTTETWPLSPGSSTITPADLNAKRFAAAAADAVFFTPYRSDSIRSDPGSGALANSESPRDRARRWRTVVKQLALKSLRKVTGDLGDSGGELGSDLDQSGTTTFVPVPGSLSDNALRPSVQTKYNELGSGDVFFDNRSERRKQSPPPLPHAVRRSSTRSALEWSDLGLIATYMTTTRLLSASLDEWRARTQSANERRRVYREQRMLTAMAERDRTRIEFTRSVLLRWRDACRVLTRERRARYGSVSRASIRRLTRSPVSTTRSIGTPNSMASRSGGSISGIRTSTRKSKGGGFTLSPISFGSLDRNNSLDRNSSLNRVNELRSDYRRKETHPPPVKLFGTTRAGDLSF
tara:strand:- start:7229 stop:9319 length:2091 start_codon:yes stop_codon:yes gene_type:complete